MSKVGTLIKHFMNIPFCFVLKYRKDEYKIKSETNSKDKESRPD